MNSQCCGLWMYCKAFGSRLLQSAYLKLPSELKEIGRNPLFLFFFGTTFFYGLLLITLSAEVILLWLNYPWVQHLKS